ncbi:putative RING-H2 finger protein ATL21A [Quercus lobata]|uniref:putative RING-H2 finger protein ATL21A n=1 Tax=Quercus lobata TaxID=97700 RepID=UPI001247F4B5|nr:putative RING-H2 finger protein ATL21A [Quercus lobata]
MDISLRIVIPTLLLFVLFIVDLGEGHKWCPEVRCGDHGPDVRFPFQLIKDRQPDHHGGFDLYCNDKDDTVLELSTSVKAFVKKIDYKSQSIEVTDSDGCFPRKIRGLKLNLSSSSFQFKNDLSDYALFKCTPDTESSSYLIPCLSSFSTSVYAFPSERDIDDLSILSCTKMYSVSSVPFYIWRSHSLQLTWSGSECGRGEVKGNNCRFEENSTDVRTECKDKGTYCIISTQFPLLLSHKFFTFQANMYLILSTSVYKCSATVISCNQSWGAKLCLNCYESAPRSPVTFHHVAGGFKEPTPSQLVIHSSSFFFVLYRTLFLPFIFCVICPFELHCFVS